MNTQKTMNTKETIAAALLFLSGFDNDPMQEGVSEMIQGLEQAFTLQVNMEAMLQSGIDSAAAVTDNWERGNLASAVHELDAWSEEAKQLLQAHAPTPTIVVVEVQGGLVQGVSTQGAVDVVVLDYDNGADDPDEHPIIPQRNGDHASVAYRWTGKINDPEDEAFAQAVLELANSEENK